MNILFLSLINFETFSERNIYSDLLREFIKHGNKVYCVSPVEKRYGKDSYIVQEGENKILRLKIGNIQKTNLVEKGISTLLIETTFIKGIKKYFPNVKFDLVLYATPPITFAKVIRFVKKRDRAQSYLMLKDIFPQNSVDLGILTKTGFRGIIYKYFRCKEKKLYALSDRIGCMSQKNCDYILNHNPEISPTKVEICPNCIEPQYLSVDEEKRKELRRKYGFPQSKKIFVYGGNLGKPQDVPFIVECLKACSDLENVYFVIAGSGTDRHYLEEYIKNEKPGYVKLLGQVPKDEYDAMIACCDVGLIFLDHRFTIPNFPSRLLSYMDAKLPIIAITDNNSDAGDVIENGGFGWKVSSNNLDKVVETINTVSSIIDLHTYGENGYRYMQEYYTAEKGFSIIMKQFEN